MSLINFEIVENVGRIYLNRPEKYNAFNKEMGDGLLAALERCQEDDVRAIYFSAVGKAFCAGQDLKEADGRELSDFIIESIDQKFNPIAKLIYDIEKPIVAAVNGPAVGAGANLALVCDIIVASKSAYFSQGFSKIGLIPDTAGTYVLPRLIGFQKALAYAMLGDKIGAEEAERIGMIYKVFEDDAFEAGSLEIAQRLAKLPTKALGLTKQAFNRGLSNDFHTQLEVEKELQCEAGCTHDFVEGVTAFNEKRSPNFLGR